MLVDLEQKILSIDDQEIIPPGENDPLTLKRAFVSALQNNYPDEQNLTGDEKFSRFTLALRIHKAKEPMDLKLNEVSKIKELTNKCFGTLVYARVHMMLEEAAGAKPIEGLMQ